jgi:dephospho-CoA kinase
MIIGISGKIGSGKDTVEAIIQHLVSNSRFDIDYWLKLDAPTRSTYSGWCIRKFAGKLKECVSLITGIPVKDLENPDIKDSSLGEDWIRYSYATGHTKDHEGNITMLSTQCSKEKYEEERIINWQTAYKNELTPRLLLQWIGTEIGRVIHQNLWINALFVDYQAKVELTDELDGNNWRYPNWIITDMRFLNELEAVKRYKGITIRVNREDERSRFAAIDKPEERSKYYHPSETALDNASFDHVIDNCGTIEELIQKVKNILIEEKIL